MSFPVCDIADRETFWKQGGHNHDRYFPHSRRSNRYCPAVHWRRLAWLGAGSHSESPRPADRRVGKAFQQRAGVSLLALCRHSLSIDILLAEREKCRQAYTTQPMQGSWVEFSISWVASGGSYPAYFRSSDCHLKR